MTVLAMALGGLISGFAFLGCFFSALALIDPRGAQLTNDADPFGIPPTACELWLELALWLALLCVGLWLLLRRRSR